MTMQSKSSDTLALQILHRAELDLRGGQESEKNKLLFYILYNFTFIGLLEGKNQARNSFAGRYGGI